MNHANRPALMDIAKNAFLIGATKALKPGESEAIRTVFRMIKGKPKGTDSFFVGRRLAIRALPNSSPRQNSIFVPRASRKYDAFPVG